VIARHWDTFETGQPPSVGNPPIQMTVAAWMADEMPCSKGEFDGSNTFILLFDRNENDTIAESDDTYKDEKGNEIPESPINDDVATQDAQCLYQIVLQLADDDLDRINLFSENETRDISDPKDGTPDIFIDAWGQPIHFAREPTAFTDSDINDSSATNPLTGETIYFPLIFSCGPDKTAGVNSANGATAGNDHLDNIHNHRMNARLQ